jgi:hypothetical protein
MCTQTCSKLIMKILEFVPLLSVPAVLLGICVIQSQDARPVAQQTTKFSQASTAQPARNGTVGGRIRLGAGRCQVDQLIGFHEIENWGYGRKPIRQRSFYSNQ